MSSCSSAFVPPVPCTSQSPSAPGSTGTRQPSRHNRKASPRQARTHGTRSCPSSGPSCNAGLRAPTASRTSGQPSTRCAVRNPGITSCPFGCASLPVPSSESFPLSCVECPPLDPSTRSNNVLVAFTEPFNPCTVYCYQLSGPCGERPLKTPNYERTLAHSGVSNTDEPVVQCRALADPARRPSVNR